MTATDEYTALVDLDRSLDTVDEHLVLDRSTQDLLFRAEIGRAHV